LGILAIIFIAISKDSEKNGILSAQPTIFGHK
jgi:hypothetical protein